jgi:hypothetical protein
MNVLSYKGIKASLSVFEIFEVCSGLFWKRKSFIHQFAIWKKFTRALTSVSDFFEEYQKLKILTLHCNHHFRFLHNLTIELNNFLGVWDLIFYSQSFYFPRNLTVLRIFAEWPSKFPCFSEILANFIRSKRTSIEKRKLRSNRQNSRFYGVVNLFARTLSFGKSFSA